MTASGPLANMPDDMLQYRLDIVDFNGFHLNYPYGRTLTRPIGAQLKPPLYQGLTFRVFFYATQSSTTTVKLVRGSLTETKWFLQIIVTPDSVRYQGALASGPQSIKFITSARVKTPGFYSSAIEMDVHNIRAKYNNIPSEDFNMGNIKEDDHWFFSIDGGSHIIVSIHASGEQGDNLPANKLGTQYFLDKFPLKVGSFAVYAIRFTGNQTFSVMFDTRGNPGVPTIGTSFNYTRTNEIITVSVRHTPNGYLILTSTESGAKFVQSQDYPDRIAPYFGNAVILQVYCALSRFLEHKAGHRRRICTLLQSEWWLQARFLKDCFK
ncbi:uncharacterized protein LOC144103290 [Amblyomma americanum]